MWVASWAGVNALGWSAALAAVGGLARVSQRAPMTEYVERAQVVVLLLLCGAILGFFQWVAVRKVIEAPGRWILATAVGLALPATPLLLPSHLLTLVVGKAGGTVGLLVLAALLSPGVAQYRVLRTEVGGAGQWVFTSSFGLVFLGISAGTMNYFPVVVVFVPLGSLFYSAFTGWTMYRLTRVRAELWAEARAGL
jgi:hypothetical protein